MLATVFTSLKWSALRCIGVAGPSFSKGIQVVQKAVASVQRFTNTPYALHWIVNGLNGRQVRFAEVGCIALHRSCTVLT
jgi:hypothetical protein